MIPKDIIGRFRVWQVDEETVLVGGGRGKLLLLGLVHLQQGHCEASVQASQQYVMLIQQPTRVYFANENVVLLYFSIGLLPRK